MRTWGTISTEVYDTLDERLQRVMTRVRDEVCDVSLLEGFRNEEDQNQFFDNGTSKVRWPDGKHNRNPSLAVDFQPYPWPGRESLQYAMLAYVAGAAIAIAREEGITLRWGGDWNSNGEITDETFLDLFHLEVSEPNNETNTNSRNVSVAADRVPPGNWSK